MRVLVVGGAGYIGSHTVKLLNETEHEVWVYDNLSMGHRQSVRSDQLIVGDLFDRQSLERVLEEKRIEAVMHFAAFAYVGESVQDPAKYYQNNIVATLGLFESMRRCGVKKFVFSSTTATYGQPEKIPIAEDTLQLPINPYGFTKLVIERALKDYAHAYGFAGASLRYFNASGAASDGSIGEDHTPETHLIPLVLQVALGQRDSIQVFGSDYPTPDGTCIRDYIHVEDLATAHLAALEKLQSSKVLEVNLGTGVGNSVLEVINACRKASGHPIPTVMCPRRAGDPAELVAECSLAKQVLGWEPRYRQIDQIVQTAWNWHLSHPRGYADPS
ncbi:MAG: UDP-glucose 4-epimerase GalE [Planctomycetaceae bacterium]|jgi:UDP-glucose 4-epimerase|nr:UDP-glucose 4-epimerase GalE [Planctomycetaceae bacterium]